MNDEGEAGVVSSTRAEQELAEEEEEGCYCRVCGALITTSRERIEVDGGHEHTFVNPFGYIYRIACFRNAPGCLDVGEPTEEFTWFARHAWSFAVCASCRAHLGWAYLFEGRRGFYGLLVEKVLCGGSS